jgi:3-methyl-2-oxobutanoate hydroxymethyltransferase
MKREMVEGMRAYADEVRDRSFPAAEHTYSIEPDELERFREVIAPGKPWDAADFMS